MMFLQVLMCFTSVLIAIQCTTVANKIKSVTSVGVEPIKLDDKRPAKRGLGGFNFGYGGHLAAEDGVGWPSGLAVGSKLGGGWEGGWKASPSPNEVSNIIAMAKQASANVLIAQQQVQAARENVLTQQRMASEKEAQAQILTQKSEAAAAIQRSEAASAAQAVVLAQHRLAVAKNAVAQFQRVASNKESQAASALQNSAKAAAIEIQRAENEATKLSTLQRSASQLASHQVAATKDAAFSPLTSGNNNVPNIQFPFHLPGSWNLPNAWNSHPGHWNAAASPWAGHSFAPPKPLTLWG